MGRKPREKVKKCPVVMKMGKATISAKKDSRTRFPQGLHQILELLVNAVPSGSPALLMKLACLVRNDRMRLEVANQSDLWSGVLLCSHLHFFLSLQD